MLRAQDREIGIRIEVVYAVTVHVIARNPISFYRYIQVAITNAEHIQNNVHSSVSTRYKHKINVMVAVQPAVPAQVVQ